LSFLIVDVGMATHRAAIDRNDSADSAAGSGT
jgi:hypothetical protein